MRLAVSVQCEHVAGGLEVVLEVPVGSRGRLHLPLHAIERPVLTESGTLVYAASASSSHSRASSGLKAVDGVGSIEVSRNSILVELIGGGSYAFELRDEKA